MGRNQRDENLVVQNPDEILISSSQTEANGTANVTISNVAPSGVGTATISQWLKIRIGGTFYYIPMWT